jgi:hypothetical protein
MTNATKAAHSNFTFSALVFALFGWVLLHASLILGGASIRFQVIVALLCLPLVIITLRRCRLHIVAFGEAPAAQEHPASVRFLKISNAGWFVLLIIIGAILGKLLVWGWIIPLSIFTVGLTFVPWSRISLCRMHLSASIGVIAAGTAFSLLTNGQWLPPIQLAIGAWALWMSSIIALLRGR